MDPDAESLHQIDWIQMMEIQNTVLYSTVLVSRVNQNLSHWYYAFTGGANSVHFQKFCAQRYYPEIPSRISEAERLRFFVSF